ncbi:hypothetical protein HBB16_04080 [Pseudonocardia sp. MCCB 268]|nr:hypothetical protein [Pseudonocardia cytotoxica]
MTRLADRMVAAGFIERLPCPSDPAGSPISGSRPRGRRRWRKAAVVAARELRAAFLDLEDEQVHTFDIILDQLRRSASEITASRFPGSGDLCRSRFA